MAKRRNSPKTRTRYVTKAKKYYGKARSAGKGFGRIIEGAIAGALTPYATRYLGQWGQPAATIGVGMYMKNDTLQTIGGYSLGLKIGSMIGGATGTTDGTQGGYY